MKKTWSDGAPHKSGFVTANGIRLHYLDWGGSGAALVATLLTERRDYTKVRSPALAIYAETMLDVRYGDSAQQAKNLA